MKVIATEWFRTEKIWPVIAMHAAVAPGGPVVWSGGCGSGEEAYSAAVIISGLQGARVIGTELDAGLVAFAQRGIDRAGAIASARRRIASVVPWWGLMLDAAVQPEVGAGGSVTEYRVGDHVREVVEVRRGDLRDRGVVPERVDVALVRNVWRHLDPPAQTRLARSVREAMGPRGLLVLGGADWFYGGHEIEPHGLVQCFQPASTGRFAHMLWRPR